MSEPETLQEKIEAFDLLRITPNLVEYLKDLDPDFVDFDIDTFQFVKFYKGRPYFYTVEYVEKNSLAALRTEFAKIITT